MTENADMKATACCGETREAQAESTTVRPAHRVDENETGITLSVALPGVRKEDLTVSATDHVLTIGASRSDAAPETWGTRRELPKPDRYELRIRLHQSLDPAKIGAKLENGVLRLDISRREEAVPRSISVN